MTHRTIVVNDDPQSGSMLEFSPAWESAAVSVADPASAQGVRDQGRTPSALIVDDDADIRSMLELFLKLEGFEVSSASDGASALAALKSTRPDVILLDIMMPVLNGFEVLERLGREGDGPHIPVIVLTAKTGDEDVWEGWCRGADSYITKPIDIDLLYQEIARVTAGMCAA